MAGGLFGAGAGIVFSFQSTWWGWHFGGLMKGEQWVVFHG